MQFVAFIVIFLLGVLLVKYVGWLIGALLFIFAGTLSKKNRPIRGIINLGVTPLKVIGGGMVAVSVGLLVYPVLWSDETEAKTETADSSTASFKEEAPPTREEIREQRMQEQAEICRQANSHLATYPEYWADQGMPSPVLTNPQQEARYWCLKRAGF